MVIHTLMMANPLPFDSIDEEIIMRSGRIVSKETQEQLSASIIIKRRRNKFQDKGFFDPDEIDFKCKFCKHFCVARTPLDSPFRKMAAWKEKTEGVVKKCPCPHLNGIKDESGELSTIKGQTSSIGCEEFFLDKSRVPSNLLEAINEIRNGTYPNSLSDEKVQEQVQDQDMKIEEKKLEIEKLMAQVKEFRGQLNDLRVERDYLFLCRYIYTGIPDKFAKVMGEEYGMEQEKREKEIKRMEDAGYKYGERKTMVRYITSEDIERIMRSYSDVTYGGNFKDGVDICGKKLSDYIGESFDFETFAFEVRNRGSRKLVIFRETEDNFINRKNVSILTLLCGDLRQQWALPAKELPVLETDSVNTDQSDEDEDETTGEEE